MKIRNSINDGAFEKPDFCLIKSIKVIIRKNKIDIKVTLFTIVFLNRKYKNNEKIMYSHKT